MPHIEVIGPVITDDSRAVLLVRERKLEDNSEIYELPSIQTPAVGYDPTAIKAEIRHSYELNVVVEQTCGDLVYYAENGLYTVHHLVRARLTDRFYLAPDKWQYVNLALLSIERIGLGIRADRLRWQIQNEEIRL